MKYLLLLMLVSVACAAGPLSAQTVLTAPMVAGCPSPSPPVWPVASSCKYNFYPLTDGTHAIASISKTAPQYQHTLGGYGDKTTLVVGCPINATLSADAKSCLDSTGADASALVPIANLATFTLAPAPLPPQTVVVTSVDNPAMFVTFTNVPNPGCFTVNATKVCVP